ncbi:MAG: FAD-dependent oxidoreductase, partial [Chitinophagaceae bacterium]|nr:FAD-dependent oxidoreductase [Chitinophagaceae bacterium]
NNIDTLNIDCGFKETSAYLFAQNEQQQKELDEIYEANNAVGVQSDYVSSLPYSFPFQKAIEVKGQAKFIPTKYVFALAKAFENMGGSIIQQCRVTGVENNDTVTVQTTNGDYSANALVYATHIPPAVNLLHLRCVPYRSYAMAVSLKDNFPDNLFYDMYDPYHYYRTQEIDGITYLIGGGYDHKTAHEPNTNSCFLQLEAHMRETFEVDGVNYKWSSQYFEPADGIPYIGHLPGVSKNIYVATGYGGNGMVYSSVAAMLLTKIINGEETPYKELYHPGRIKPIAGFTTFIQHNADVVKQFAGKLFDAEKLPELADLAPGEGRLVSYEKQKIALYKDDNGKLYAVNPVCTHLKCDVKWNVAEKSWDCPCHGARYDINGKVLTGPADRDLEQVELKSV